MFKNLEEIWKTWKNFRKKRVATLLLITIHDMTTKSFDILFFLLNNNLIYAPSRLWFLFCWTFWQLPPLKLCFTGNNSMKIFLHVRIFLLSWAHLKTILTQKFCNCYKSVETVCIKKTSIMVYLSVIRFLCFTIFHNKF